VSELHDDEYSGTSLIISIGMWVTRQEAADHLKISLRTLDSWAAAGHVVFYRVKIPGTRKHMVRYRIQDLNELLERAERPAADD
jgi:phage terminase Nu1 subunit (DNA packaging protein)